MCGDMASDLKLTPLLLGLGLDELSVVPSFVPKVKKAIRAINISDANQLTKEILSLSEASAAQDRLNRVKLTLL